MEAWRGGIKRKIYSLAGYHSTTKRLRNKGLEEPEERVQNILPDKQKIFYVENTTKAGKSYEMSKDIQILHANHINVDTRAVQHAIRQSIRDASSDRSSQTQESWSQFNERNKFL